MMKINTTCHNLFKVYNDTSSTIQPYFILLLLSTGFFTVPSDFQIFLGMDDNAALTQKGGGEKTTTADWSKQLATWLQSVSIFETCIFR
jgi:hypothetical protein